MNYKKVTLSVICIVVIALLFSAMPGGLLSAGAFSDVSSSSWYAGAVSFVSERGLFNGVTADLFKPDSPMTRAMFITVVGRYAGVSSALTGTGTITKSDVNLRESPSTSSAVVAILSRNASVEVLGFENDWYHVSVSGKTGYVRSDLMTAKCSSFDDVPFGSYYGSYVHWANSAGIVGGTSSTEFSPNLGINREQICKILYSYLGYSGKKLVLNSETYAFPDQGSISSWAVDAVNYLHCAGVVGGRSDGSFDPKAVATRAEVATILMRFDQAIATNTESPDPEEPDEPDVDDTPYEGYIPFGNVVPESSSADMAYFSDALFIGHSILNSLSQNYTSLIPNAGFFTVNGATSVGITDIEIDYTAVTRDSQGNLITGFFTGTLDDALSDYNYTKVYIMLGINEIGAQQRLCNNISAMVDSIRAKLGNIKIYIISVTPLSREYTENSDSFRRANLLACNTALMQMCIDKNIYYLDMFSTFADSDGFIVAEYTTDGVHLSTAGCYLFVDYLRTHTM